MIKSYLAAIFFTISTFLCFSQVVAPLEYRPEQANNYKNLKRLKTLASTLNDTIPFFDDFVNSNITPDPNKWLTKGGTYVNNNYPLNHPNYNVVTFDGLNAAGVPYNRSKTTAIGPTDTLTSVAINLSSVKDSLFLRFAWQAGGIADIPDPYTDSLILEAKDKNQNWKKVWFKLNDLAIDNTKFYDTIIKFDTSLYLHSSFQFRFLSFGRQSGNFDIWSLDYIMLDTTALANTNWSPDRSFRSVVPSLLKNYTAMPVKQYWHYEDVETQDSVGFKAVNLQNIPFSCEQQTAGTRMVNVFNNKLVQNFDVTNTTGLVVDEGRDTTINYKIDLVSIKKDTLNPRIYEYSSTFRQGLDPRKDSTYFSGTGKDTSDIDFTLNDSIKGRTYITNYYAHDDGTPELMIGVNSFLAKVAVEYKVNVKDTLTDIQIYFPNVLKSYANQPLELIVWTGITNNSSKDQILYHESVPLQYGSPSVNNGFTNYKLITPQKIDSNTTIFVGYQQNIAELIPVGFDKNTDSRTMSFFNTANKWVENTETGSVMIRALFGTAGQPTGILPVVAHKSLDVNVYPNPSKGELNIDGKVRRASLYDLTGKLLINAELDELSPSNIMNVSGVPNGLYMLLLENGEASTMEKLIINR